jgi:subtilisin family serine protease
VIGVAAIGADGLREARSQVGAYVRIAAPGGLVTAAALPSGLATFTGTSFAAPFVSGAAALVLQRYPEYTPAQVAARLYATADPVPDTVPSTSYGYGVVNPYRAVTGAPYQPGPASPAAVPPAHPADASAPPALSYRSALIAAGAGGGFAVLLILVAVVLPRGLRRRWRPGS